MPQPRGYTRREVETLSHHINQDGARGVTVQLDGTVTTDTLRFGDNVGKLSFQLSGSLVADIAVSINGIDFVTVQAGATAGATLYSYDTHNVMSARVTRTAGTGYAHFAGV
jgi:hypothetical protein